MKKLLGLIIGILLTLNIAVLASDIEVQPTMYSRSNAQDRVWVGTFQLVWNEFIDNYVHRPVRFREGTPEIAKLLNLQTFTTTSISDNCYYKFSGKISKNTKQQIEKSIKKKFKEKSDILDKLDLTPSPDNFLIYAMLKKDFEFLRPFDKLGRSSFGENQTAEYFGIGKNSKEELGNNVFVLFYNNENDFAVRIIAKNKEEVYLYKNGANKSFDQLYADMNKKQALFVKANGDQVFNKIDELKVPNIKFNVEKSFNELTNKRVMGTSFVINQALETVKFEMNHNGVKLKSEAAMTFLTTAMRTEEQKPRFFYCDNTFVIFLKEKDKTSPYFALRVNNIENFQ